MNSMYTVSMQELGLLPKNIEGSNLPHVDIVNVWNHAEGRFEVFRMWMLDSPDFFIPTVLRDRLLQLRYPDS